MSLSSQQPNKIANRLAAIRSELASANLDAFIIPRADEYLGEYVPEHNERLYWATDFTGSAGMAIVLKTKPPSLPMVVIRCKCVCRWMQISSVMKA